MEYAVLTLDSTWDESKVKRDAGKFAPKEGAGKAPEKTGHKAIDFFTPFVGKQIDVTKSNGFRVKGTIVKVGKTPSGSKSSAFVHVKQEDGSTTTATLGMAAMRKIKAKRSGKEPAKSKSKGSKKGQAEARAAELFHPTKWTGKEPRKAFDAESAKVKVNAKLAEHIALYSDSSDAWQDCVIKKDCGKNEDAFYDDDKVPKKWVKELTNFLKTSDAYHKPRVVMRGISSSQQKRLLSQWDALVDKGKAFQMKGFTSTTTDLVTARGFGMVTGTILEIHAKTHVPIGKHSNLPYEQEYLAPPGVKYRPLRKTTKKIDGVEYNVLQMEEV